MLGLTLLFLAAYVLVVLVASASIVLQIVRPRRKTYAIALGQGLPTDPADLDMQAEDVTFNLPGNHSTPGWIIQGNQPDAPAALILHGHRDANYGALCYAQQLLPHTSHIVVFDWPSHGGCTAKWMTCGKRESNDAIAVLEGLPDYIRNKPMVLLGYSLGGQIAIKTAALFPRFVGVIAVGAYRRWDTPIRMRLAKFKVPAIPIIQLVWLAFCLTGLIRKFDRAIYAAQINVPLLVLHGTDDGICPIEEGRELAEAAPHATFVSFDGGPHNQLFAHDPELYQSSLTDFFSNHRVVDACKPKDRFKP